MKKFTRFIPLALLFVLLTNSCKKSDQNPVQSDQNRPQAGIPSFPFDYEHSDYMPTPPGVNPILVPWASGSNQLFSEDIAFDYKNEDGWRLVYNSFNSTQLLTSPNFFALYNKYSGILRFYLYIQPGNPTPSSYFSDGLTTVGTTNSTLTSFGTDIVDIATPLNSMTRIQNYQLQSTGGWYVCQYEMAYDPTIANANQQNLNFLWNTASINVSNVTLNGESNGTLTGTVGSASSGGFNLNKFFGTVAEGALFATGFKGLELLKIGDAGLKDAIVGGAKGGLTGSIKGMLSAVLGGTETSPQLVNLTLKTKINMQGSITTSSGIASPTLAIPGTVSDPNSVVGYVPIYNEDLGVVNMQTKPIIQAKYTGNTFLYRIPFGNVEVPLNRHGHLFASGGNNRNLLVFNPVLLNEGVTFQVLREDIVVPIDDVFWVRGATDPTPHPTGTVLNITGNAGGYNAIEKIGTKRYAIIGNQGPVSFAGLTTEVLSMSDQNGVLVDNVKWKDAAVRFTILVTPPNGGKPLTIIKTFKATVDAL